MESRSWPPSKDRAFFLVVGALTILAVVPLWIPRILPMQDYPHMLVFARAWGDCRDPATPFFGTYERGFPLAPLVLPILVLRAIGAMVGLETAGRVLWTLYAVALPVASIHLLAVLGRDRWAVLLVYPILISYWVTGGFLAFATAAPIVVLGLALAVRWLEAPSWRSGARFAAALCAAQLWHALAFAELGLAFGVLWLLWRAGGWRARLRALAPFAPGLALLAAWLSATFVGRAPGSRPPRWPPFVDNALQFFDFVGPPFPHAAAVAALLALLVAAASFAPTERPAPGAFRLSNPFAAVAAVVALGYFALPADCFGVQGIDNRQPWVAVLLAVFAWRVPSGPRLRALALGLVGGAGALVLVFIGGRFLAFDRESAGASRLIDRLGPGETLLAPLRGGTSESIPGRPLAAVELYATLRHGGLPNASFAGYECNIIRYAGNKNPMPGLVVGWLESPGLTRYDYVLLRGTQRGADKHPELVRPVAKDGDWTLYEVCGSKAHPSCG